MPNTSQDAEHILRGHLLPSQLCDVSWIVDTPDPDNINGLRDVANRHLGAFGFPAPYGHAPLDYEEIRFNMDVVGGATGSLCEAWRTTVPRGTAVARVNMLFDYDDDTMPRRIPLSLWSPAPHSRHRPAGRHPQSPHGSMRRPQVTVFPAATRTVRSLSSAIDSPTPGEPIRLPGAPHRGVATLPHRTRDTYVSASPAIQVVAMDNFGADLRTYFPEV